MKKFFNKILARSHRFNCYLSLSSRCNYRFLRRAFIILLFPVSLISILADSLRTNKNLKFKYNLSAVVIIKDEGNYLKEWLDYYKLLGFEKIYVFDNESDDNTLRLLQPFIKEKYVSYHLIKGKARQMDAYNIAINISRKESKYLAIIDADEFIFLPNKKDNLLKIIDTCFKKNRHIGGLAVNWLIFGSSGYKKKPSGLVTQNYYYRSEYGFKFNKHVKTICDPRKVAGVLNPHYVEYNPNYYSVNTSNQVITGAFSNYNVMTKIRINHYFTKSFEEFLRKRDRGKADQQGKRSIKDFNLHDKNQIFDDSMKRYKKKLEEMQNE